MSGNVFGNAFRVMTFGESHGPYIGVVIDGLMPGLELDLGAIQHELDRRKPGQSDVTTPRKESDQAEIVSGLLDGKTTGTPLCILIRNQDQRSGDYKSLENILRPGHASFTFLEKYGVFDYRGGGRASGRETATRVAAGAVARQFLKKRGIEITGYTRQIGNIVAQSLDMNEIEKNAVRCPDPEAAIKMIKAVRQAKNDDDSLGGVVEIVVKNCPAGLGEPVFNKLDADLAAGLMSIGAVKAFEIGSGFEAATKTGSQQNDPFYYDEQSEKFMTRSNNAGGVLGGITNGMDLVMRITVKPPSSIRKKMETANRQGQTVPFGVEGRHDPCICPRVVPVAEAMTALVLMDHILMQDRVSATSGIRMTREKIDTIDSQILLMLAQRFQLTREIAALKKKQELDIQDSRRETDMLKRWQNFGETLNLSPTLVKQLLSLILEYSRRMQKDLVE